MDTWVWVVVAVVVVAAVALLVSRRRRPGRAVGPSDTEQQAAPPPAGPALPPPTGAPVFPEPDGVDDLVPEEERFTPAAPPASAWDSSHDPERVLETDEHADGVDAGEPEPEHEPAGAAAARHVRTRRERRQPPGPPPVRTAAQLDRLHRARDRADDVIAQHGAAGPEAPAQPE